MSVIQDQRVVTKANGCARIFVLAESVTSGVTAGFSVKLSMPDDGITYNTGTIKGKKNETSNNFDCGGNFAGKGKGDQVVNEKDLSLTFADDFNQVVNYVDPTVSINILIALFEGTSFTHNGDTYTILGVNGVRYTGALSNNLPFKSLFLEDGKSMMTLLKEIEYLTSYQQT